jgi:hypothetical protein
MARPAFQRAAHALLAAPGLCVRTNESLKRANGFWKRGLLSACGIAWAGACTFPDVTFRTAGEGSATIGDVAIGGSGLPSGSPSVDGTAGSLSPAVAGSDSSGTTGSAGASYTGNVSGTPVGSSARSHVASAGKPGGGETTGGSGRSTGSSAGGTGGGASSGSESIGASSGTASGGSSGSTGMNGAWSGAKGGSGAVSAGSGGNSGTSGGSGSASGVASGSAGSGTEDICSCKQHQRLYPIDVQCGSLPTGLGVDLICSGPPEGFTANVACGEWGDSFVTCQRPLSLLPGAACNAVPAGHPVRQQCHQDPKENRKP